MQRIPLTAARRGYHEDALSAEFLLQASRNMLNTGARRPGYQRRRQFDTVTGAADWLERIPLDEADGTLHALLHYADDFVDDADAVSAIESSVYDPFAADDNPLPSWVHAFGRTVWAGDGNYRLLIHDGADPLSKAALTDPAAASLSAQAGGSMTQGEISVRIRWYDEDTGTYSGPDTRTAAATTVTLSGGNSAIQVTMPSAPARASHWQIQTAVDADTPGDYEIHYHPKVSVGGADIGDSVGRIGKADAIVYLDVDPTSGTQFQYRTLGAVTLYRHANPPAADFVCQFRGRIFYASRSALWLVWSESGEAEAFYHDTSDPTQGFNTLLGEALIDSVGSPCTGLAANEAVLCFFTRSSIIIGEGSWALIDERRDARMTSLTQNSVGMVGRPFVVDQDIHFFSQDGPKTLSGASVDDMSGASVRRRWRRRDPAFEHRSVVCYDPGRTLVLYGFVSLDAPVAGVIDTVLAWDRSARQWCAPFDVCLTSMVLHRLVTDAAEERGTRLILGLPYGDLAEWGAGHGDGWDGSDADAELASTSDTTLTATVSTASWAADEHRGASLVLIDAVTGRMHYRQIKSNTGTMLTWEGAASDAGGGWILAIGGIPAIHQAAVYGGGDELVIRGVTVVLDDRLSRES